jgi:hypothetical protein
MGYAFAGVAEAAVKLAGKSVDLTFDCGSPSQLIRCEFGFGSRVRSPHLPKFCG